MKSFNRMYLIYRNSKRNPKIAQSSLKSIFIVFLTLTSLSVDAQDLSFVVKNDSIYTGIANRYVGYIVQSENNIKIAYVANAHIGFELKKRRFSHLYDKVRIGKDVILKFDLEQKKIFDYKGDYVGKIQIKETLGCSILPPSIIFTMFHRYYSKKGTINMFAYSSAKIMAFAKVKYDLSEKNRIDAKNREKKRLEEKLRIERFYALVYERLEGELDLLEGVYKSVDQGDGSQYDIAVLKSDDSERDYVGLVLNSTQGGIDIGAGIFSFEKTAQLNLFFVKYTIKSGKTYENKTAVLNGALLTMGIKSFVKMYPSESDKRKYSEINPLFDWESSGSGVLINSNGYIVTNNHVAKGANKIRIAFQNDSINYNAVIVSQNEQNDVAILKIVDDRFTSELKPVKWSNDFNLGQKVFTLGYPISNKMSDNVKVVDGIVSGKTGRNGVANYFQTTLPVWYGNSGGPCFNSKGEILGLATQILWDKGVKMDNVAYITKTKNILELAGKIIPASNGVVPTEKNLEELLPELIPYSVFIKVNY